MQSLHVLNCLWRAVSLHRHGYIGYNDFAQQIGPVMTHFQGKKYTSSSQCLPKSDSIRCVSLLLLTSSAMGQNQPNRVPVSLTGLSRRPIRRKATAEARVSFCPEPFPSCHSPCSLSLLSCLLHRLIQQ